GGRSYSLVTIFPDSLVIGRVVPAMTLTHELNHAVLREWLGDTYRSTPTWWREGVAVHSAGQTERRLRVLLAGKISNSLRSLAQAANIVPSLINGIKDKHDFDDYAEDVLLIEWALSQNPKALVEMVAAIKEGKDVEGAYAASLGMTWAEALATGFDYARRRMYALEGGNHIKVVKAVQSLLERSAEVSKGVEGAKEGLLAHIKDADKALDYKADQSIEKSNYAHLVWAYYRLRGLALAGEEANAIKGLIAEVNDDDGQIRATTLTTAAVRRIVDTAIAAKDWETAKEWVTRLEYGYAYGSTTAAWVKAKREAIAQGKAGTSDENAADDEPNEQPNEDDQQDGKD
ncbi:MAG: hypothetical protein KDB07_06350, partial [Planctomycetes bacterium]|nr:hypothetical protein [Planctomycetota bacterium]